MDYKKKIIEALTDEQYPNPQLYFTISIYKGDRLITNISTMGELREAIKTDSEGCSYMDYYDLLAMRRSMREGTFKEDYTKVVVLECQFDDDSSDILYYGDSKADVLKKYYQRHIK